MFQSIRNAGCFCDLNSALRNRLRPKIPNVGSLRAPTSAMKTSCAPNMTSAFSGAPAQPLSAAEIISKYYLQENVAVSTFINAGTELLFLTHKGIDDDRVLNCVERLNADVIDDYIKQQVFLCATENFSKVHSAERTVLFRELISRHTGKFDACESFLPSDAVMWSDNYIKALAIAPSVSKSGEKLGSYLDAHLNQLVNSIAATPKWFHNVEIVRRNLLRILNHRVTDIELFGSSRSGLSSMTSDADMTCSMRRSEVNRLHEVDADAAAQAKAVDREYVTLQAELIEIDIAIAGVTQFRNILSEAMKRLTQSRSEGDSQDIEGARLIFESSMRDSIVEREHSSADRRRVLRNMEIERANMLKSGAGSGTRQARSIAKAEIFNIGSFLKRSGYQNVNMIAFAKVPVIKLRDPKYNLDIDLIINKRIATHNSELVREYLQCDSSGKIRRAAIMLKYLVKTHGLGDASSGTISSYTWIMLLLHTLLHHEYLPPLQRIPRDSESDVFCENFFVGYTVKSPLPCYYESRLAKVSVAELLMLFTEYITSRVDVAGGCLTLRGKGEVLPKACWLKAGMISTSWCLSVEDPFERADSVSGHDLGNSIRSRAINDAILAKLVSINQQLKSAFQASSAEWKQLALHAQQDSTKGNWDGDILSCFHVPVPSALGSILVQQDGNAEIELEVSREGPIGTGAAVRTEDQAVAAAVKKKKKRLNQSQRKKSQEARMTDGDGKSVAPPAASSGTAIPVRQPFRDLKRAGVSTQNTVASQVPRTAIPQTDITRTAADGAAKSTDTTRTRSRPLQATKSSRPQFQREQQQDGSAGRDQIRMALSTPSNPT